MSVHRHYLPAIHRQASMYYRHPIEVRYFDCNGGVLQMELVNEKGEKEMLPGAWLKHEVHARV